MQSQPNQTITPIIESSNNIFDFKQKDFTYNNKEYRLYIAIPKTYHKDISTPTPVLYMLDGNGQFPMLINQISSVDNNLPIIVGIGYPSHKAYPQERTRDYTTPIKGNTEGGGAKDFFKFISTIAKPFIESSFNIDTTRQTLCGHSFGGLFTLYVLFNHAKDFQNYIAASPSLWWDKSSFIPNKKPLLTSIPKSITITVGEYELKPESDPARKDLSPEVLAKKEGRVGGISAQKLYELLAEETDCAKIIIYEGKNHGTSIAPFLRDVVNIITTESNSATH